MNLEIISCLCLKNENHGFLASDPTYINSFEVITLILQKLNKLKISDFLGPIGELFAGKITTLKSGETVESRESWLRSVYLNEKMFES